MFGTGCSGQVEPFAGIALWFYWMDNWTAAIENALSSILCSMAALSKEYKPDTSHPSVQPLAINCGAFRTAVQSTRNCNE
jgi:hypothetical protein